VTGPDIRESLVQLRRLTIVVLALAAALPAVPASAAKAKPKPCNQLTDDSGDGSVDGVVKSDALDILSADVSSGKNEVTATLRLKSAAVESDNALAGGAIWNFNVTVTGVKYSFQAHWPSVFTLSPRVLTGSLISGNDESNPKATFTRVGNNFMWTVNRSAIPGLKKAKTYIYITGASDDADSLSGDTASAKPNTKYLDKTVTCLPSK
jgi:hypothetical protein